MILGSLTAVLHGFVLPAALLVLAFITDAFKFHEISRFVANIHFNIPFSFLLDLQSNSKVGRPLRFGQVLLYSFEHGPATNEAYIEFNVQNLTGGIVNCTTLYTLNLPHPYSGYFEFTVDQLVTVATVPRAVCYTNETFTDYINVLIFGLLAVVVVVAILGACQMLLFHITSERQMKKLKTYYFKSILRQEMKWHDLQTQGELSLHLTE